MYDCSKIVPIFRREKQYMICPECLSSLGKLQQLVKNTSKSLHLLDGVPLDDAIFCSYFQRPFMICMDSHDLPRSTVIFLFQLQLGLCYFPESRNNKSVVRTIFSMKLLIKQMTIILSTKRFSNLSCH